MTISVIGKKKQVKKSFEELLADLINLKIIQYVYLLKEMYL